MYLTLGREPSYLACIDKESEEYGHDPNVFIPLGEIDAEVLRMIESNDTDGLTAKGYEIQWS